MADVYIHSLTDLWNDAGTDYHAIKMNVTNSASSAASRLLTLQVGGADRFYVDKNGNVVAAGTLTSTGAFLPSANDAGALGASGTAWSDLFLASGGVINWNAGDVTATHSANALAFAGASSGYSFDAAVRPSANDSAALGSATVSWADLFLASGAVLNFANGNVVATHSSGVLTLGTGDLRVTTAGTDTASVVTVGGTQTLANKSFSTATSIASSSAGTLLTVESTEAGATAAVLDLYRNSASPAANDITFELLYSFKDSAGNKTSGAKMFGYLRDPTNGSEDFGLLWETMVAGTATTRMALDGGLWMVGATGGDPGTGKINATDLLINSKSIATDAMSGFIGAPANKTYTVSLKCPFGGTINETVTICASGTCTATFKINGTPLGGTANSVSSSEQTQAQASANTFVAGDDIAVTISSNSSCVDMAFTIKVTKSF